MLWFHPTAGGIQQQVVYHSKKNMSLLHLGPNTVYIYKKRYQQMHVTKTAHTAEMFDTLNVHLLLVHWFIRFIGKY